MNSEVRAQFPLTDELVYLETGGIGPTPVASIEAAHDFLEARKRNPDIEHHWIEAAQTTRQLIADLIHANADEIAFTASTSDGMNLAAHSLDLQAGDSVVLDDLEYYSNKLLWEEISNRKGVQIRVVKSENGVASPSQFEAVVDETTKVISITLVSHINGYLHDARALSDLAHKHGGVLIVDAVQAVGSVRVDVRELGIDFLACGSYKWLLGPSGLGFLFVNNAVWDRARPDRSGWMQVAKKVVDPIGIEIPEQCVIFESARKFECGTINWQGVYELKASLELMRQVGWDNIYAQILRLSSMAQEGLMSAGLTLACAQRGQSGVTTGMIKGGVGKVIGNALEDNKIIIKSRPGYIRVDTGFFNTEDEVATLIRELEKLLLKFGGR